MRGTLYLVPTSLGAAPSVVLPAQTRERLSALSLFVVENAKSARQFLKAAGYPRALQDVEMHTLNEHSVQSDLARMIEPLEAGRDCGLLSEAGCPAVADPGAPLIRLAHERGIPVVPLVGPSAVLLALMASGLNGQRFCFHGYLPVAAEERASALRALEQESRRADRTQIFIETPYRNDAMLQSILNACHPGTLLCVAADISLPSETVVTRTIEAWRKSAPALKGRPAVFLLYADQKR